MKIESSQPFIVFCGPVNNNFTCAHVIVNNFRYNFTSTVEAVDCCFKIFHTLHLEYSLGCLHVWGYFQRYIYDIPETKRKIYGSDKIAELHGKIERRQFLANSL